MSESTSPKRAFCAACARPQKTCLCAYIVHLECPFRLIILQDPTESKHALSSAPLLEKSIIGAQRHIGEAFEPSDILGDNWQRDTLLVYPQADSVGASDALKLNISNIVLIDGTWRKAARLLHFNPWLNELPSIALQPDESSRYRIRKSPRPDGLATIEAAAMTLNQLQEAQDFRAILPAFEQMIDYQIQAMGAATYKNNY